MRTKIERVFKRYKTLESNNTFSESQGSFSQLKRAVALSAVVWSVFFVGYHNNNGLK